MTTAEIQFYLSHRSQIAQWAKLESRSDNLMRDIVTGGDADRASQLLKGDSGDDEIDFYVRNRLLINEWDNLQTVAGEALHAALVEATQRAGFDAVDYKRGWFEVRAQSAELNELHDEFEISIYMAWTKAHLLSTRRGYPFPRVALELRPSTWQGERRQALIKATQGPAHELGMKRKNTWWVHWRMLNPIPESQQLQAYADDCVARLQEAATRLQPVLQEALTTIPPSDTGQTGAQ